MNNQPRILVVSSLFTGMKPVFVYGNKSISGMPAFFNVLKTLSDNYHVDMIIISKHKVKNNTKIFENLKLYHVNNTGERKFDIIISLINGLLLAKKLIKKNNYKFFYGFGYYSAIVGILSFFTKIPNFRRLFGSFFAFNKAIDKSKVRFHFNLLFKHSMEYLSWILTSNGLIVTDDGTKGYEVAQSLNINLNTFHFLKNGVNKKLLSRVNPFSKREIFEQLGVSSDMVLGCSSCRLEKWKRVDKCIEICKNANEKGINFHLVIIGEGSMINYLRKFAQSIGIYGKVHFIGSLPHNEALRWVKTCDYFLSFYEFSNLGNSLIEAMHLGKVIISLKQFCFKDLLVDKKNAILFDELQYLNAGSKIFELEHNKEFKSAIENEIVKVANKFFLDWKDRNLIELKIINNSLDRA